MIVIGKQEDDVENERRESVREKGRREKNTATQQRRIATEAMSERAVT